MHCELRFVGRPSCVLSDNYTQNAPRIKAVLTSHMLSVLKFVAAESEF